MLLEQNTKILETFQDACKINSSCTKALLLLACQTEPGRFDLFCADFAARKKSARMRYNKKWGTRPTRALIHPPTSRRMHRESIHTRTRPSLSPHAHARRAPFHRQREGGPAPQAQRCRSTSGEKRAASALGRARRALHP